jgi:heptaprenyl diphosphate synthase
MRNPVLELPFMAASLERVEAALRASVRTDDDFLTEIASHLILAGGKRLRPVMAVAAAAAGSTRVDPRADVTDDVVMGGVSVELVHLGSLYHDDVMDEADMRRTVPSVNARWGNLRAILAGDFLLARASEIAASLGVEVAALLARTIGRLCEGQLAELQSTFRPTRSIAAYEDSIAGKTASLFASSCRIGALVAGHPRPVVDAVTDYGHHLGMVFQVVDDLLDITRTEAELGKPAGHDMVEGVYTLPVIVTLAAGGAPAERLAAMLGRPLDEVQVAEALEIVRAGDGIPAAVRAARAHADRAVTAIAALPAGNEAADALRLAPHALIDALGLDTPVA